MIAILFFKLQLLSSTAVDYDIEPVNMDERMDHEISAKAVLELPLDLPAEAFSKCVPVESTPFPKKMTKEIDAQKFDDREIEGLMKCSLEDCAFNFITLEKQLLQNLNSIEDRKALFFKFYQNRISGITPMATHKNHLLIRAKDKAFEDCDAPAFSALLDDRPISKAPFRLSISKYGDQMRTTARLLNSASFKAANATQCYAEALLFSDHYDEDRVEVWSLASNGKSKVLKLQIRHRVDLLNSWVRRLSKEAFRKRIRGVAGDQVVEAGKCMMKWMPENKK